MGDRFEELQRLGLELAVFPRDERHDAPRLAAHGDRQREQRAIARFLDHLTHARAADRRLAERHHHGPTAANRDPERALLDRPHAQRIEVFGRDARLRHQDERVGRAIEPEHRPGVHARGGLDDFEHLLAAHREIVAGADDAGRGVERLNREARLGRPATRVAARRAC